MDKMKSEVKHSEVKVFGVTRIRRIMRVNTENAEKMISDWLNSDFIEPAGDNLYRFKAPSS